MEKATRHALTGFPSEASGDVPAKTGRRGDSPFSPLDHFRSEHPSREAGTHVSVPAPAPPQRGLRLATPAVAGAIGAAIVIGTLALVLTDTPAARLTSQPQAAAMPTAAPPVIEAPPIQADPNNLEENADAGATSVAPPADSDISPPAASEHQLAPLPAEPAGAARSPERIRTAMVNTRTASSPPDAVTTAPTTRPAGSVPRRDDPAPPPAAAPVSAIRSDPVAATVQAGAARDGLNGGQSAVGVEARVPPASAAPSLATPLESRPAVATPEPERAALTPIAGPTASAATIAPRDAIDRTLRNYQAAFNRLDVDAVRQVWPSVDTKALARSFEQLRREDLTLRSCEVTTTGTTGVATCDGTTEYVPKVGSKSPRMERHRWRISLHRTADQWLVTRVEVATP